MVFGCVRYLMMPARESLAVRHTLHVCSTCLATGETEPQGAASADKLRQALADAGINEFEVKTVECMSMCDAPTAVSIRAEGKAAYLFSGIDPVNDSADILAFAKLYAASDDGWIEDARPIGRLRFCLTGRIPA